MKASVQAKSWLQKQEMLRHWSVRDADIKSDRNLTAAAPK